MEKEKIGGVISIVGAILTFISVLLPVSHFEFSFFGFTYDEYYWIWGYSHIKVAGWGKSRTGTIFEPEIYGIICGLVIIIASLIALILGGFLCGGKMKSKAGGAGLIIMAIMAILAMVSWIIIINIVYVPSELATWFGASSYWDIYEMSYGIYVLFVGAGIMILGAIIALLS